LGDYRRRFPRVDNTAVTEVRLGAGPPALLRFNVII
jgi:hypothetical protein